MSGVQVGRHMIPETDLEWAFTTSGGPGGQHANRSNTRVELRYALGDSTVFPEADVARIRQRLSSRMTGDVIVVTVDESRSQFRNRAIARRRLAELLTEAMRPPTPRKRTRPTRASKRRRLEDKRRRSETKRLRKPPPPT